jgi:tRNA-splicing ligase RtcB
MSVPIINFASIIDDKTMQQAEALARLPFVSPFVALMPDAHWGHGSSVGTVIPTERAIIPAAVGVDIGCGMIAVRTEIHINQIKDRDLSVLRKILQSEIPLSPGNYNDDLEKFDFTAEKIATLEAQAARDSVDLMHSKNWRNQLGSLGGGNHFIELCVDQQGYVWLFLHSGSRGVGNKIASKHIRLAQKMCKDRFIPLEDQDHAFFVQTDDEFWQYMNELRWAQKFALLNRDEMMDRYVSTFMAWIHGWGEHESLEVERVNAHHNYTESREIGGKTTWLTRKGAIDASEGKMGLIPGSMGDKSYVVMGLGNKKGLYSAPHGAGRAMSRGEARKKFTTDDLAASMVGIDYRDDVADKLLDEHPAAYKPIGQVMEDAKELVVVVHELDQLMNLKGEK